MVRAAAPLAVRALAAGGAGFTIALLVVGFQSGRFGWPPHDLLAYLRGAGDMLAGRPVYTAGPMGHLAFLYGPPWAVLFALVSWVPAPILGVLMVAANIAGLRYMAGSWTVAGLVAWCPLLAFDLASANITLLVGAAILAAVRGQPAPLALAALAKLSPVLVLAAADRRTLVRFAQALAVLAVLTLPWAGLWADWAAFLVHSITQGGVAGGGPVVAPLLPRIPLALALVALRRPWAAALAAVVATPALYWVTLLQLVVPARLALETARNRP